MSSSCGAFISDASKFRVPTGSDEWKRRSVSYAEEFGHAVRDLLAKKFWVNSIQACGEFATDNVPVLMHMVGGHAGACLVQLVESSSRIM